MSAELRVACIGVRGCPSSKSTPLGKTCLQSKERVVRGTLAYYSPLQNADVP